MFHVFCLASAGYAKTKVWIDFDNSFGKKFRDVDDGLSLIYALNSPTLDIIGISHVFGNIDDLEYMKKSTQEILLKHNRNIPTFNGARSNRDIGLLTPAVKAMAKALKKNKMTILAMGRLTNIATLVTRYPISARNIEKILVMGGRHLEGESAVGPKKIVFHDSNIDGDLRAVRMLLKSNVKLVMISTESMKDFFITKADIKEIEKTKFGKWVGKKLRFWQKIWKLFIKTDGFIPFDVFLVGYLTNPEYYTCLRNIPTNILKLNNDVNAPGTKKSDKKNFLVSSYKIEGTKSVYCKNIERSFKNDLLLNLSKK